MTATMAHLKSDEFVDAMDGVLPAARRQHLDACQQCRAELTQFQELTGDVTAAGVVPEPSPLFWSHMSDRVRVATEQVAPARGAWGFHWRWVGGAVAAMAVVLVVAVMRHEPAQPQAAVSSVAAVGQPAAGVAAGDAPGDDESFTFVVEMASSVPYEELQDLAVPTSNAADAMVGQLTDAQRVEFVRLLRAEAGSPGSPGSLE